MDAIFSVAEETAGERLCVALQQDLHHSNGFSEDWLSATKEKNLKAMAIFLRLFKLVESQAFLGLLGSVFMEQEFFDRFLQFTKDNDTCLMAFDVLDGIIQKPLFQLIDAFFLQYLGTRLYIRKDQRMHESKKDVKVTEATDRAAMFSDLFPVPAKSCTAVEEKRDCENYIRESNYAVSRSTDISTVINGPMLFYRFIAIFLPSDICMGSFGICLYDESLSSSEKSQICFAVFQSIFNVCGSGAPSGSFFATRMSLSLTAVSRL